jgi:hypothetical protein
MEIKGLPFDLKQMLYGYHEHEIRRRIPEPVVAVFTDDPIWPKLDELLTGHNNVLILSRDKEIEFTVHELLDGVYVIWLMDDHEYVDEGLGQAILINETVLEIFRDGGMDGLVQYVLFKNF